MLTFYGAKAEVPSALADDAAAIPDGVDWIDAFEPTPKDVAALERCLGIALPSREALIEVEASSRMSVVGDAVLLSFPVTIRDPEGFPRFTPIGLVVTERVVVTIRFSRLSSFEALVGKASGQGSLTPGGPGATISILEMFVDHFADVLERIAANLDEVSRRAFEGARAYGRGAAPRRTNRIFGEMLYRLGLEADLGSKVNESLLVLTRIAPYLAARALPPVAPDLRERLDTIVGDARSLREFQDHLSSKSAFLLDALLGLSNIEQNNIFRILTIVSIVAIPPTLVASLYGMNFKYMPELDWLYGYAYGLALIALGALVPSIWFKLKGWW